MTPTRDELSESRLSGKAGAGMKNLSTVRVDHDMTPVEDHTRPKAFWEGTIGRPEIVKINKNLTSTGMSCLTDPRLELPRNEKSAYQRRRFTAEPQSAKNIADRTQRITSFKDVLARKRDHEEKAN